MNAGQTLRFARLALMAAALLVSGCSFIGGRTADKGAAPAQSLAEYEDMARSAAQGGRAEAAFLYYDKILALNPDHAEARLAKADLLSARDLRDQALAEYGKVLALAPGHAGANQGVGLALLKAERVAEAEAPLRRALAADPKLWKAHHGLGLVLERAGRGPESLAEFQAALSMAPAASSGRAVVANSLGVALLYAGRTEEAVAVLDQAVRGPEPLPRAANNLGLALARLGREAEALDAFRLAGDEAKALNNLGWVLLLSGRIERASRCFEQAVAASPGYYGRAFENLRRARAALDSGESGPAPALETAPARGLGAAKPVIPVVSTQTPVSSSAIAPAIAPAVVESVTPAAAPAKVKPRPLRERTLPGDPDPSHTANTQPRTASLEGFMLPEELAFRVAGTHI